MADLVSDVLEDGTIRVIDLDLSQLEAEKSIKKLWKKQDKVLNFDFSSAMLCLFIETVHILTSSGWTTEELIAELITHSDAEDADNFIEPFEPEDDRDEDD